MNWYKIAQLYNTPRNEYVSFPENYDSFSDDEQMKFWEENRKKRNEWDNAMQRALATGKISPQKAFELGYKEIVEPNYRNENYSISGHGNLSDLPETLYHVTTSKDEVVSNQLKTRDELSQSGGAGLGGGSSDTISFTEDLGVARDIYRTLVEGKRSIIGEFSIEEMISQSKQGAGAKKPWDDEFVDAFRRNMGPKSLEEISNYVNSNYQDAKATMFPETLEEFRTTSMWGKENPEEWSPVESSRVRDEVPPKYRQFTRLLTPQEKAYRRFKAYHLWAWTKQSYGEGPDYPLFAFNNEDALGKVQEDQIAILEFKSNPGALGYQVSALGEWRTWSGEAVKLVREVK
jgi:hypothetical protein